MKYDEIWHFDGNFVGDSKHIAFINIEYLP